MSTIAAEDFYVTMQGGGVGSDCGNSLSIDWLNNSNNWVSDSIDDGLIGPGDTVHLCGEFNPKPNSTLIHIWGNGTYANPITLFFEPNALIKAPHFNSDAQISTGGAIFFNQKEHIIIDGGLNGTLECNETGSEMTYYRSNMSNYNIDGNVGVYLYKSNNITVKNLNIKNLYQSNGSIENPDWPGRFGEVPVNTRSRGMSFSECNNITVFNNTIYYSGVGLSFISYNDTGIKIHNNNLSRIGIGIMVGGYSELDDDNLNIYNNTISDTTDFAYNDGIKIIGYNDGSWWPYYFRGVNIHHNIIGPKISYPGHPATAWILLGQSWTKEPMIHHNLLIGDENDDATYIGLHGINPAYGLGQLNQSAKVYSNTMVSDQADEPFGGIDHLHNSTGSEIFDNIMLTKGYFQVYSVANDGSNLSYADNNSIYNFGNTMRFPPLIFLNEWQSQGHDLNSNFSNPLLNINYRPVVGSPVCSGGIITHGHLKGEECYGINLILDNLNNLSTNDSVNIYHDTMIPMNTTINYGINKGLGNYLYNDTISLNGFNTINDLTNNTLYYYNLTTCFVTGVCNESGPYNFTTQQNSLDNNSPLINNLNNLSTNDSVNIYFDINESANATLNYGTTESLGIFVYNYSYLTNQNLTIFNLINNTLYYYNITVCDQYGNCNESGNYNFTTSQNYIDTNSPLISNLLNTTTNESVNIIFDLNESGNVSINYGINNNLGFYTYNNSYLTNQNLTIFNLINNTLYYYNITVCDQYGNCNESGNYNFRTNLSFIPLSLQDYKFTTTNNTFRLLFNCTNYINYSMSYFNSSNELINILQNNSYSKTHNLLINNLDNNTLYYYNMTICNEDNLCNELGPYNFTTDPNYLPILLDNIVSHWKFDVDASDYFGNNDGVLFGNASFVQDSQRDFVLNTNTSAYVNITHSDSLNLTNNFSISFWVKTPTSGTFPKMIIKPYEDIEVDPWEIYSFDIHSSGKPRFSLTDGYSSSDKKRLIYNYEIAYGSWHYIVGVLKDNTMKLFYDGVLVNSTQINFSVGSNNMPLLIGYNDFEGYLDDVFIFNTSLDNYNILQLYCDYSNNKTLCSELNNYPLSASSFDGNTTDFYNLNYSLLKSNLSNINLERSSYGRIEFLNDVNISLLDLDNLIHIDNQSISVDSSQESRLNRSARLSFYNMFNMSYPVLLKDGFFCSPDICFFENYSTSTGMLIFNVTGFSNYSVSENYMLDIWDSAQDSYVNTSNVSWFYANYTNISFPITNATCNISFSDGNWSLMDENNGSENGYNYSRIFNTSGIYTWNVSCNKSGFGWMNSTDIIQVGCTESWSCGGWSSCVDGSKTRSCFDVNSCGTYLSRPDLTTSCIEDTSTTSTSSSSSSSGGGGGGALSSSEKTRIFKIWSNLKKGMDVDWNISYFDITKISFQAPDDYIKLEIKIQDSNPVNQTINNVYKFFSVDNTNLNNTKVEMKFKINRTILKLYGYNVSDVFISSYLAENETWLDYPSRFSFSDDSYYYFNSHLEKFSDYFALRFHKTDFIEKDYFADNVNNSENNKNKLVNESEYSQEKRIKHKESFFLSSLKKDLKIYIFSLVVIIFLSFIVFFIIKKKKTETKINRKGKNKSKKKKK